ncbi:MAG TPA: monovalent cation/H(+) antiporter subunit G [Deinococcales bacterium]|nr:monovalent cation/H(+) antiporter subunit G [Deinococcales bacterium]
MRRFVPVLTVLLTAALAFAEDVETVPNVVRIEGNVLAEVLILFGCFFILISAIGMVRFPDVYTRLHASTKLVALGGLGIFIGAALAFQPVGAGERVLLIFAFFFLTAPLSGYMISRAVYLLGVPMYEEETTVDEWQAFGSITPDPEDDTAAA